ncbi:membrane protein insertion efficiency factor YidD [Pseudomonas mosselii]|uniref:membrane protein insertion efficiency factor YidD n=1 Tax=Pseudomonas mosselii TaxID=78327 RepID=UPI002633A10E|nr:membrane protein insertion efficiency factor YidD [Pseudomonas mosselii]MDN4497998.1 membrane protein insertion efficiency factor YidD [Pseudomonas mosselii]
MIARLSVLFIKLYQRYAPDRIRSACRYTPSCSSYALMAIEKYGACRGWRLALARIYRCKPPNGGQDFP